MLENEISYNWSVSHFKISSTYTPDNYMGTNMFPNWILFCAPEIVLLKANNRFILLLYYHLFTDYIVIAFIKITSMFMLLSLRMSYSEAYNKIQNRNVGNWEMFAAEKSLLYSSFNSTTESCKPSTL